MPTWLRSGDRDSGLRWNRLQRLIPGAGAGRVRFRTNPVVMPNKWSASLTRPVSRKIGTKVRTVRTLAEAARLALDNKTTGQRQSWQHAAKLLMDAAASGEPADIEAATRQRELAMLLDGSLIVSSYADEATSNRNSRR